MARTRKKNKNNILGQCDLEKGQPKVSDEIGANRVTSLFPIIYFTQKFIT